MRTLTVETFRYYTDALKQAWDGVGYEEPAPLVCPLCGAIIEGSEENVARHIEWHKTTAR